jgi:hypothetical protein
MNRPWMKDHSPGVGPSILRSTFVKRKTQPTIVAVDMMSIGLLPGPEGTGW